MKIIRDSPEHHYLTFIDHARQNNAAWVALHCAQSETLSHDVLIEHPGRLRGKLQSYKKDCEALAAQLAQEGETYKESCLYEFSDGDLLLLVLPTNSTEQERFQSFYKNLTATQAMQHCRYGHLNRDYYAYQNLADERLYSMRRMEAYAAMGDEAKTSSIPIRRTRRKDTLVQIVEDDRFVAAFAASILNKDYEIIHSKTGEDAIADYIEYAPDVVFQDIHLPGLNGHETLNAIKKIDPAAYVIMLSGDAVKYNIVEASRGGAAGFLKKPFSHDRMTAMVKASPFYKPVR
ncbi:MAG TPA: response regulator [Micavibrio sp.]